uniref:Uncharacterized protein n=1 Tax=Arundo donax TaxID=35708 RepID=A0A0A9A539_ARUDO
MATPCFRSQDNNLSGLGDQILVSIRTKDRINRGIRGKISREIRYATMTKLVLVITIRIRGKVGRGK